MYASLLKSWVNKFTLLPRYIIYIWLTKILVQPYIKHYVSHY